MKKFYYFFCTLLITGSSCFSQPYLLKSEIMPDQNNRDSRFTVQATVMQNDTWCKVTWPNLGNNHWELVYDDGEADDFFIWSSPGNMNANKFHPTFYPFIVIGGSIYVGDGSFPGPFLGTSFRVLVYDDDGENGLPGTALDSMDVTVNNYEWVEFEGMTVTISEGDFYLAMEQMSPAPDAAPIGVDMDNPTYFKSYVHFVGGQDWVLSPLQDFMIRAWIVGYNEPARNIDYFQVARFSDFDPYGSPLLGDTTILLDSTNSSEYDDYAWDTLSAGLYAYGVKTHFTGGEWSDYDVSNNVTHLYFLYPPSCLYQSGNYLLMFCPPMDSNGDVPPGIIGYNLYRDGDFVGYIPNQPEPAPDYIVIEGMQPGIYQYGLSATYDLTSYGYPGETGESMGAYTDFIVRYGYPLPFLEQWNLGTFETNNWTADGSNWSISGQVGNPIPSAQFTWDPIQTNYEINLESYPLQADSMTEGRIYLDFDIKLSSVAPTGTEKMLVQVWNWESRIWISVDSLSNIYGSFGWGAEHIDITDLAMHQIFKIRFSARGENSINILAWFIDYIHVYRECNPPLHLEADFLGPAGIALNWEEPDGISADQWIHWDDGDFSGNSISAGLYASFAARWTPDQLTDFEGAYITKIAFVPGQGISTYRVRVWKGEFAADLLVDQDVPTPVMGQWNTITLNTPVLLDITQELWVGYYLELEYGYPGGVDDGPAVDGYGNMVGFSDKWQTLLEINPALDYNWNIQAFIEPATIPDSTIKYAIYRSDDGDPYFLRDYSDTNYYLDDSFSKGLWCYYVTALYINETDSCESPSSYEDCVTVGINEKIPEFSLNIYPNPCNNLLKIESSEELGLISVYNSFGELILKKKVDARQVEIPVAAYPVGVYMVRVDAGKEVISRKVMVVH
jgi:hypothetical protein